MRTSAKTDRIVFIMTLGFCCAAMLISAGPASAEEWPLAGNWIATVPSNAGPLLLVQSIVPQDATGTRFSTTALPAKPNYTFFGIFPDAQSATPYVGHLETTGPNTFTGTMHKYAMKQGASPVAELVYLEVTHLVGSLVDADTMTTEAKVAVFLPSQDADADGFPDVGQEPQFCSTFLMTAKRQTITLPYETTPSPIPFCEYGTGVALQLGAGQAIWDQVWGAVAPSWYKCSVPMNVPFLGENVVGLLETANAGPSAVDENLVVRFTYGGKITLNKLAAPGSTEVIGKIVGEMDGICIADLNAEHATLDEDGNIVIVMNGPTLSSAPDIKIKVVEATGVFADIKQVGTWRLYMAAKVTIARDPTLALQKNIMMGLNDPKFLIAASEEFALTGWYYRE